SHVHDFVEQALPKSAVAKETNSNLIGLQTLRRKRSSGCDSRAAADDGIGSEVAGVGIGNVHRTTLAFAVARFFAEQLGKHPVERCSLGDTVPVARMRAGDVVILIEGFAYADGDRFLTYIKVSETGHEGPGVEVIHLLFEEPDHDHPPIHMKPLLGFD